MKEYEMSYCLTYYMQRHNGNGPNLTEKFDALDDDKARQRVKNFVEGTDRKPLELTKYVELQ